MKWHVYGVPGETPAIIRHPSFSRWREFCINLSSASQRKEKHQVSLLMVVNIIGEIYRYGARIYLQLTFTFLFISLFIYVITNQNGFSFNGQ